MPNQIPYHRTSLYPPFEPAANPPTWEDVERLAMHYPQAHAAVTMVRRGDITREQALLSLVFIFAREFAELFQAEVDRRMMTARP